tara:strand:+ start:207 stop:638 length:432 start_codon:yes stop_codon:yes gene_type:complete
MPDLEQLITDVFWKPDHPVNRMLNLTSATKSDIRTAISTNRPQLELAGYLEPNLDTLRFYADSGHGWLEVLTVDVTKAGIIPSKYSYVDVDNGRTYLEEDCDMAAYLAAIAHQHAGLSIQTIGIKEIYINGDAWIRDLPHCNG